MKDKKKSAVFGLSASVAIPCQNGEFNVAVSTGTCSCRAVTIILTPRYTRYAAPAYFTTETRSLKWPKSARVRPLPRQREPSANKSPER